MCRVNPEAACQHIKGGGASLSPFPHLNTPIHNSLCGFLLNVCDFHTSIPLDMPSNKSNSKIARMCAALALAGGVSHVAAAPVIDLNSIAKTVKCIGASAYRYCIGATSATAKCKPNPDLNQRLLPGPLEAPQA